MINRTPARIVSNGMAEYNATIKQPQNKAINPSVSLSFSECGFGI